VHNRRYFDEQLRNTLARARRFDQPIAMILFDIDKFKYINDTLGHAAGDMVLEALAGLAKARARASDVFARLGGDEFVFILEKTSLKEAKKLGDDLLALVTAYPFSYGMHAIPVTLSIGIAEFPHPPREWEAFYKATDDALYEAKRNGKNQVVAYSFDINAIRLVDAVENEVGWQS
jgi:diguanylate cyclase (GGDEF)-like protein